MRPTSPSVGWGIVVALVLIALETLAVYPLHHIAPQLSLGVVYLLGVLVVSSVWGLALGTVTALVSTAAFDYFHVPPAFSFVPQDPEGPASLFILLLVALLLCAVAALARSRAIEADRRRREADLAAEMARLLLRTDDLRSALPAVSRRLAETLGLAAAALELEAVAGDERLTAFPLRDGRISLGTLLVPADLPRATEVLLRDRVAPSAAALLRAACDREAMRSALRASRDELRVLAEEQAALRRVATLAARGARPEEVFARVVEEVGRRLPVEYAHMGRYEPDRSVALVAVWGKDGERFRVGSRFALGGHNLITRVFETSRSARIDDYASASGPSGVAARESGFHASVATPIIVEGRLWGFMAAGSPEKVPLPKDAEARLADFTELLATAIANAESRAGLARLAEQQAALRRVATLVARRARPDDLFAGVVEEVGRLLPVNVVGMGRYEPDETVAVVASWGEVAEHLPVGSRPTIGGKNLVTRVFETGRPARMDDYGDVTGPFGAVARDMGFRSAVGSPIIVEGRRWGLVIAGSSGNQPLPVGAEARLADFTELMATAIANAESRAALAASRARVVAAADQTRRRIERDLHDGAQQRLVSIMLELRAAQATLPPQLRELDGELSRIAAGVAGVFDELREISHGIHPAILSKEGLEPALRALARRSAVRVDIDIHAERRLPEPIEVAVYYVVSEAVTNAAKHARASKAEVNLDVSEAEVRLAIRDDGIGGADPARGLGLVGLSDRIDALGGTLEITSPTGSGTTLRIEIPVEAQSHAAARER